MHRDTSRKAMHRAALRLATNRGIEAVFEEWHGVHPHDRLATGDREARRSEARRANQHAGKRIAYVCEREARARTKSTAELRHNLTQADHLLAAEVQRLLNGTGSARRYRAARAAVAAARSALAERLAEAAQQSEALETNENEPHSPVDLAPLPGNSKPPGLDTNPERYTRRSTLTLLSPVERLTRTLTLAPGAPSRAVCV